MNDMITCNICGIVERGHTCPFKKQRLSKPKDTKARRFRSSAQWTQKSIEIRERDRYLCQVCEANLYNTIRRYNSEGIEVHHITPIEEDYELRYENDNLITLCQYHHKMADKSQIPRGLLRDLIRT